MKALPPIVLRAFGVAIPVVFVVASWYLMGYLQRGDEFLAKIRYENLERFTSSMQDEPHKHSALYLFGMLGLGLVPWTVMVVVAGLRNRPWQSLSRAALVARWKALPDLYQFSLLAAVCIVFFFCIPSSKRSVYLLPAYPFLAIWIERMIATGYERVSAVLTRLVVSVLVLAGVAWIVLMIHQIAGVSLRWGSFLQSLSVLKVLSVLGVGALLTLVLRDVWRSALVSQVNALALATISAVFLISFFVYDTVAGQLSQKSWLHSSQFLSKVDLGAVDRMYSYGSEAYGASFYLQKPFARATNSLSAGSIVFVEQRRLNDLREALGSDLQEVGRYSSGLEKPSRDLVVVRTITSSVR